MKKLFSILAAVLFAGSMMATESVVYTLTPASGSNNSYAGNCDIEIDGITWNLTGNSQQLPWRIGGKSLTATDRELYSKTAIESNVSKIEVEHGTASGITVNSFTVIVASDADFENVISTLTPAFEASATATVLRPEGADWSNAYYKFVYNVTIEATSNKFLQFTGATFYAEDGEGGEVVPPTPEPETNYYLVGSVIGWTAQEAYKLAENPAVEGEYMIEYTAAENEGIKVLGIQGETQTWYKDGMGNEYIIAEAGDYTIYFRPAGNPEWSYTYFTLVPEEGGEGGEEGDAVYTLTPAEGSNNSYAGNCDIEIDGITWNLTGNSQQLPWRIGGKSLTATDRELYSKTAIESNVSKIEVEHGTASGITVNSFTVIVASDADFENVISTLTPAFEASATATVLRPEGADWSNAYYKFVYNVTVEATSNKFLQFVGAKFYGPQGPSTAIDNNEVEMKAVKRVVNGQLFIEKNGVLYNAQGAVVR